MPPVKRTGFRDSLKTSTTEGTKVHKRNWSESPETRGWLLDVMKCVESLGKRDFTLEEVYAFERHLGELYPGNQNVKPKIRQQLQFLRDRGFIDFVSRGNYRLRS